MNNYLEYLKNSIENAYDQLTFERLVNSAFISVFAIILLFLLKHQLRRLLKKLNPKLENILFEELKFLPVKLMLFSSLYFGSLTLKIGLINYDLKRFIDIFFIIVWVIYLVRLSDKFVKIYANEKIKSSEDKSVASSYSYISAIYKFFAWLLVLLIIFSLMGLDVSALIAGFGISGFAIAFAMRNIIRDMISSFIIIFEKIVQIGDYIKVGDSEGEVKKIGTKSTTLKTDAGHDIIVPNGLLVNKPVHNFKSREKLRVDLELALPYPNKLEYNKLSELINKLIKKDSKNFITITINLKEISEENIVYKISSLLKTDTGMAKDEQVASYINMLVDGFKKKKIEFVTLKNLE